jgi:alpha-mannosidase
LKQLILLPVFLVTIGFGTASGQTNATPDLSTGHTLFEIGYSHLDTQWRWSYPQVIGEYLPDTVNSNIMLFEKYPDFIFNWTGANRYRLIKEYHPDDFDTLRKWIAAGRWFPAGNSWEENDVNVPSPESIIRQVMFGHDFFKQEFGTESSEYMIPDCFGFPASLPSILAHCGIRGFSTQKLTWGSAVGIPFNVGMWVGPDGNSVIAALNPGPYNTKITNNLSTDPGWLKRINEDGAKSRVYADFAYYGAGDRGGAPAEDSVKWIEESVHTDGPVHVISARANEMFNDITDEQKKNLPQYKGDLLLTEHSAGSITSQAYMKKWNRDNEVLANDAETAAVAANLAGALPYPREKLHHAWELVLANQFHDMLPGTSLPKVYEYCWNDEIIAMNCFAEVLQSSVGAVARGLDTRSDGAPLVVYNPLSVAREDVVDATVKLPAAKGAQVFDGDGRPVPTQVISTDGNTIHFLFLAKVKPVSFTVFSAEKSDAPPPDSSLSVTDRSLENNRYKIAINDDGDIAGIYDKIAQRELLSAPARLDFQMEDPARYPAWNMDWADQQKPPRGYVGGPAKIQIVENGPVRAAIQIEREGENSIFTQTLRLAAGDAGNRVEIENHIDWQDKSCALKAEFPLAVTNFLATYNWDLGKIQRGNNDPAKFEVPSHQWFDLTDKNGEYGVSILCPTKYGSDKPSDNVLRLTMLFTPGVTNALTGKRYQEQQWQDWGRHDFVYGIYGHDGDWRDGKSDWQSARLSQPLLAFTTTPHDGKLGKSYSFLQINSDQIAVRAIKLAENGDKVIVRLQELNGQPEHFVHLTTTGLKDAVEVNGIEQLLNPLSSWYGLWLSFTPYQMRTLELSLTGPQKLDPPFCRPVDLPYNINAIGKRGVQNDGPGFDGNGSTIPAEMICDEVVAEGITFHIGPHDGKNAVTCQGQNISLPNGPYNQLYLLAASVNGDTNGEFDIDGNPTVLKVQNWTGYIGQWDNRIFEGQVPETTFSVPNPLAGLASGYIKRAPLGWFCSHRRLADGGDAIYSYSYLFKYRIPLSSGGTTLTLPNNPGIRIVAATVAQDDNDNTQPAQPLYDDFTGRQPVALR